MTDWFLLRRFRDDRSEAAFAQLVARYLGMVYSVCYAELRNAQAAEDATQAVFLVLASKAQFQRGTTLAGWLFRTARYVAKHARRAEMRRSRLHDDLTILHSGSIASPETDVDTHAVLSDALSSLREADREALLLRFYQDLTMVEVGEALGVSEEAARKRVSRSLDRLRTRLQRHGVGAALGLLTAGIVLAIARDARSEAISHAILRNITPIVGSAVSTAANQLTLEVLRKMTIMKLKWTVACAMVIAVAGSGTAYVMGQGTGGASAGAAARPGQAPQSSARTGAPVSPSEAALQKESLDRMRQLELAFVYYLRDVNYQAMPPMTSAEGVRRVLDRYVKNRDVFLQPGVNKPYQFNLALSRARLDSVRHPDAVILFYEPKPYQSGWRYIGYLDGRVKLKSPRTFAALLKESTPPYGKAAPAHGHV